MSDTEFLLGTNVVDQRLERRRSIRQRLAERDILRSRRAEIESLVRGLDGELDQATAAHQIACQPIQTEIAIVEKQQVDLMVDRSAIPAALAARRKELLDALNVQNNLLESAATDHRTRTSVLQKGFRDIDTALKNFDNLNEHSLARPDVANPRLADELWITQQSIEYANARASAAKKECEKYVDAIAAEKNPSGNYPMTMQNPSGRGPAIDNERVAIYENRLRRWKLELAAAGKQFGEALAESNRIHQAIIDE